MSPALLDTWVAPPVIGLTLVGVALGRYPGLRMNRATIALVGATALVALGSVPLDDALRTVDLRTLALLFAIMVINVNLRAAGFFARIARWVMRRALTPRRLLGLFVAMSGLLSALFLNDTVVLAFTPLVLEIVLALEREPVPYLIGLVSAANIGSVATITGNPQNILIGATSGIPWLTFTAYLLPVAVLGLVLAWALLVLLYRRELTSVPLAACPVVGGAPHARRLAKPLLAAALMLALLLAGVRPALAALVAASLLLVTRRVHPERVFREIDWSLLVFFAGLFIVTGAIRHTALMAWLDSLAKPVLGGGVGVLAGAAALLSNLVSNVPAVLLFRPVMPQGPGAELAWLTLAMGTTFAGNLTLLGSVANLIVAETAKRQGVHLSFGEYLRAGVPITLGSLALGVGWLSLVH